MRPQQCIVESRLNFVAAAECADVFSAKPLQAPSPESVALRQKICTLASHSATLQTLHGRCAGSASMEPSPTCLIEWVAGDRPQRLCPSALLLLGRTHVPLASCLVRPSSPRSPGSGKREPGPTTKLLHILPPLYCVLFSSYPSWGRSRPRISFTHSCGATARVLISR